MSRSVALLFCASLACGAALLVSRGNGEEASTRPTPDASGKIQHVVVIFQENRTPDNLFHGLPNADIANSGVDSAGQVIPLTPISLVTEFDLGHTHGDFERMYDGGEMDGADRISVLCSENPCTDRPQFSYVKSAEVAPYLQLAEKYTFAIECFRPTRGLAFQPINSSFLGRQRRPPRAICLLPKIQVSPRVRTMTRAVPLPWANWSC